MNLLIVVDSNSACQWYRGIVPGMAASDAGLVDVRYTMVPSAADVDWCDTMMLIRVTSQLCKQSMIRARESGKFVVVEVDDDLFSIESHNPASLYWTPNRLGDLCTILSLAHRLTTTTPALAAVLAQFCDDVVVIPNMLPGDMWPMRARDEYTPLRIGWAGSRTHIHDFGLVAEVLREVLEAHDDVEVRLVGVEPHWFGWRHDRLFFGERVEIDDYAKLISSFDIGIAPLVRSTFNESKSDLKVLEYAACGVPCIASAHYSHAPVLIANTTDEWRAQFEKLLRSPVMRRTMAFRERQWAETRFIADHVGEFLAAWRK